MMQPRFRFSLRAGALLAGMLAMSLGLPRAASAQWTKLMDFGHQVTSIYFLETEGPPRIGFVCSSEDALWKTLDGGNSWSKKLSFVPYFHSSLEFSSISFKDSLTGWFSFNEGLYQTNDCGINWQLVFLDSNAGLHTVYYCPVNKRLYKGPVTSAQSTNEGLTWTNFADSMNEVGFVINSSGNGMATTFGNQPFSFTSDSGISWTRDPYGFSTECHQPLSIPGTNIFFVVHDSDYSGETSDVYRFGDSPGRLADLRPHSASGCIVGSLCQLYVQCTDGVFLSTDEGKTWTPIYGPGNTVDTRFWVKGDDVYAGDAYGGLWHLNKRFSAVPNIADAISETAQDFGTISDCDSMDIAVPIKNLFTCDSISVQSISLSFPASFSAVSVPVVPHMLTPLQSDTLKLRFKPKGDGLFKAIATVTVVFDSQTHVFNIPITGTSFQPRPLIHSDTLTTRMCDSATASVTLQNPTCNQMEIDSISLPAGLTLLTSLPVLLDTASEKTLSIRVAPGAGTAPLHVGDTALLVRLHVVGASSFDTTVMLHVHVGRGVPAASISVAALNFDTVSTCSSKTLAVVILSNGCDTLTGIGYRVPGTGFRVVGAHRGALAVGASDTALITFASQTSGLFFDTLVITSSAGTETVPLQGYALSDVAALGGGSLALPHVVASCGGDTGRIMLPNLSCTSIVIDSVAGICVPFRILSGIGDTIVNSGSGQLIVSYIPQGAGTDGCTVRVYYHGADGIPHDTTYTLSASAIAPPVLALHLRSGAVSAPASGHISLPIYASATQATVVDSIRFRLNMRTDLLTPVRVIPRVAGAGTAPLQVDGTGVNIAIGLPPDFFLAADTLLATLDCEVFVTDTMQTQITLTQPSISANTTCLSLDSTSPAIAFALVPLCGDSLLTHFIGYGTFRIESIRPNPASGQLEVQVKGGGDATLHAELYDVLGRTAIPGQDVRGTSLQNAVMLDVSALPEGIYYLRISSGGFVQTRSISIQR